MRNFIRFSTISLSVLSLFLFSNSLDAKSSRKPKKTQPSTQQVQQVASRDVNKLAQEGVQVCFNAYRQGYDTTVAQEQQGLAAMNLQRSSYSQVVPIRAAKSFAIAIVNQLTVLTQSLSNQERMAFWDFAEQHIKVVLDGFCKGHGSQYTGDLNEHISSQIKMKKTFG